jgi:ABC-2 type transport system ATP-binding protein
MSDAIQIERLHYRAGKTFEIKQLDLHVPSGSIYGFLGPNGSGKTTTIRLILGLLRPLSGRITVLGLPMPDQHAQVLGRVGYVPEQPHLDATLTVRELIDFQAAFYTRWDRKRAEELVQQFELDGEHLFGRLSKGQKAKLMILLALAQCGDLLVLDEPTDGLDPVVRRDILSALLTYVSERGATIFISSHLVHELERVCDWVAVMDDGRLITEAPMEKLKHGTKRWRR